MLGRMIAVLVGVLVVAAIAAYAVFGANLARWGCPSQEELDRPRSPAEVVDAFAQGGVRLGRVAWPPELRRARSYRGAVVYRHQMRAATLSLVVCKARCELSRFQLRPGNARSRHQFGFSTINLAGWIDAEDRSSAARLRGALGPVLSRLDASVDPGSRCYVN
jgi:hypothetical protein